MSEPVVEVVKRRSCFVISPIGEPGSDVRRRADQILRHVIEPAAASCSYEAIRADKIAEPGLITSQVIQHIVEDPLVIADLTGSNPNVFYELAIRHAIRKPLVQLIQKGEKIPFDIAGMRTIPVDHKDLDSVDEARREMEKQIRAIEAKRPEDIDSPITVSLELQALRQSDNPEQRSLAEVVSAVGDLRGDIAGIEKRLSDPANLFPPELLMAVNRSTKRSLADSDIFVHELRNLVSELAKRHPEDTELIERLDHTMMRWRHVRSMP